MASASTEPGRAEERGCSHEEKSLPSIGGAQAVYDYSAYQQRELSVDRQAHAERKKMVALTVRPELVEGL